MCVCIVFTYIDIDIYIYIYYICIYFVYIPYIYIGIYVYVLDTCVASKREVWVGGREVGHRRIVFSSANGCWFAGEVSVTKTGSMFEQPSRWKL